MRSVSSVDLRARLRPSGNSPWHTDGRSGADRPVVVELEGAPCVLRLRIMEDASGYDVMAEFDGTGLTRFSVELEANRVYIAVVHDGFATQPAPVETDRCAVRQGSPCSHLALAFGQQIDAASSCGEFSDGLLHLSLSKQRAPSPMDVPLQSR